MAGPSIASQFWGEASFSREYQYEVSIVLIPWLPGEDSGLYRSHILIIPPCLDYDTNRVFGHREGAYVASSWEL